MGKVEIYNRALNLLGLNPISSVLEDNKRTRTLNLVYEQVLEELLIEEPWNFSTKRVKLPQVTNKSQTRCKYEYQYPSDCLKLNKVYIDTQRPNPAQDRMDYEIIGDRICSDYPSLEAEYVAEPSNMSNYFTGFTKCLAYKLAIECCYALINSNAREEQLANKYQRIILPKAISLDAQQEDPVQEPSYLNKVGGNFSQSNVGGR